MTASLQLKELLRPYYLRWLYFRCSQQRRPDSFARCWDYPSQRLERGLVVDAPACEHPLLVFYPMVDWHARMQRSQHLARALASLGFRCLYLNPHLGRQFESVPLFNTDHRLARLEENIFELHVRLPREPVFHHRLLSPRENRVIVSAIKEAMRAFGASSAIQIVSIPTWFETARMLRETDDFPIVYDCHDWLRGFSAMAGEIVAAEADSLRTADLVLFSSEQLRDRHCVSSKWMISRNAVDLSHFRTAVSEPPGAPLVAGYVGALDAWFDIESMVEAARANPTCHFVLAGRIENPAIRELKPLPNVEFVGEVAYDQLPNLMARFRVGLIPFSVNELTIAVNPIKLYEYFSLGLPVVSSPLPEVQRMGGLVRLAENPASFAAEVRAALTEDDPRLRAERIRIAASESWASRAQDIAARFAGLL